MGGGNCDDAGGDTCSGDGGGDGGGVDGDGVGVVEMVVVSNTNWNIFTPSKRQRAKATGVASKLNCIL